MIFLYCLKNLLPNDLLYSIEAGVWWLMQIMNSEQAIKISRLHRQNCPDFLLESETVA
jgi:hypothetical protein